jgi:hypothetical protein
MSPSDRDEPQRLGSWTVLFGSLALAAGHGVFLIFALQRANFLSNFQALGLSTILPVGWFVACLPLLVLCVLLRRALLRMALLGPLSLGAALVTVASFALYVVTTVRG